MEKRFSTRNRSIFLLSLLALGLAAILVILPSRFSSRAGNQDSSAKGLVERTVSHEDGIENYDIRTDKYKSDVLLGFRELAGKNASSIADLRDDFVTGENLLRERIATLKVEYNNDLRIPEVIAPDVDKGRAFLTTSSTLKRSTTLSNFVKENDRLFGITKEQPEQLNVAADYTNPDANLSYAHLEQTIFNIPVFGGEVKAGFTKDGKMFRVINNLAPGLDYKAVANDFRDPLDAVRSAAANINYDLTGADLVQNEAQSTSLKTVFGEGDSATTAEKMYFPIEPGVARTAWRVLIWKPVNAYYVVVDAETGMMLWRKNITNDQTQSATYNVYTKPTNMMNTANNPAPIVPALNAPSPGTQGAVIARNNVTLIGNEAPNTFNNLGWMNDGVNGGNGFTDGNNVEAGLDIVAPDGVDAPVGGVSRVFNFAYNPGPGSPAPGEAPTLAAYRSGAVTQLFYINNRFHDELYKLGFTEPARNFQNTNFTATGLGNDRVRGEAQDSSGTNNANFSTPADGGRGRMQMYVFTGPTPDYDGDLDADIVIHEYTHGLSNRLVGNASGLTNNRGGSMGEGWSDFYALALLSNPADPLAANYAAGTYATFLLTPTYTFNYYYGIRRFPYAIRSFTGGPGNLPHNPQTFADIDPAQINNSDGAFARNPAFSNTATEVHNAGEIWCVALWEVRARLITRLGGAAGNLKSLQLVTDGLKLTPNAPNFISARDAIIAAAAATAAADVVDVREGFRIRGMGFGAQDNSPAVVESFAAPNVMMTDPFSVSDSPGNNNGFPEPGENVLLSVAITNTTGATVNSVVANVNGGTNVSYGNIANGATVTMQIPYLVPAVSVCGSLHSVTINVSSAAGAQTPQMRSFRLGVPVFGGPTQNFDGVSVPALPSGWSQVNSGANTRWVTTTVNAVSAPNSVFSPDPSTPGEASLEASASITSASAQLSFSNRFSTEINFDGTVLDIRIGNGAYQDILAAGGSFVIGGYTGALSNNTPLGTRQAWTGANGTGFTTTVNLPAAANGQTVGLRWRTVSDVSISGLGTWYDNMQLTGGNFLTAYTCAPPPMGMVSGTISYVNAASPPVRVSNAALNAAGSVPLMTTTDVNGFYSMSGFGSGAYTVTPSKTGQVNGISNSDATAVAQHVATIVTLNANQLIAADVTNNGSISNADATAIAQFAVSIPSGSIAGSWRFVPANRVYASVATTIPNQDYNAYLMGEVTGNWNPALPFAPDIVTPDIFANRNETRPELDSDRTIPVTVSTSRPDARGNDVTVDLSLGERTGDSILGYQFELLYDKNVMVPRANPCDITETISMQQSIVCNASEPGVVRVVVFGTLPIINSGTMLKLHFTAVGNPRAVTSLRFQNFIFNEDLAGEVAGSGQVVITGGRNR